MNDAIERAIALALESHRGQTDKGGQAYILHPLRVMQACPLPEQKIAAVLHDTVEDCGVSLETIAEQFGATIADAIAALTKRDDEGYEDFVLRCKANSIAREVKKRDIADNMDLTRLGREPTDKDNARIEKYRRALAVLSQ